MDRDIQERARPGRLADPVAGADASGLGEGPFGYLGRDYPTFEQGQTYCCRSLLSCSGLTWHPYYDFFGIHTPFAGLNDLFSACKSGVNRFKSTGKTACRAGKFTLSA